MNNKFNNDQQAWLMCVIAWILIGSAIYFGLKASAQVNMAEIKGQMASLYAVENRLTKENRQLQDRINILSIELANERIMKDCPICRIRQVCDD